MMIMVISDGEAQGAFMTYLTALAMRPLYMVLVPLFASILIFVIGRFVSYCSEILEILAASFAAVGGVSLLSAVLAGEELSTGIITTGSSPLLTFSPDYAGATFAAVISVLWLLVSVYSAGCTIRLDKPASSVIHGASSLSMGAVFSLCFAADLMTFFTALVVLMAASYPLVFCGSSNSRAKSLIRYYSAVAAAAVMLGMSYKMIVTACGKQDFVLGGYVSDGTLTGNECLTAFVLMVLPGMLCAGLITLHRWIPETMTAEHPADAVMHSLTLANAGAFTVIRALLYIFGQENVRDCGGMKFLVYAAVFTIIAAGLTSLGEPLIRGRVAFTIPAQVSAVILGACIISPFGITGTMIFLSATAVSRAAICMAAGALTYDTGANDIAGLPGSAKHSPLSVLAFAAATFAAAGLPFTGNFAGIVNIFYGGIAAGKPFLLAMIALSSLFIAACLGQVIFASFGKGDGAKRESRAGFLIFIPVIMCVIFAFVLGIKPDAIFRLRETAMMLGNSLFNPLMK